jgi:hypothetical protein
MTLLFMDGFDHYGTGGAGQLLMLDGVWADITSGGPTPNGRYENYLSETGGARLVLDSAITTKIGIGFAFRRPTLPDSEFWIMRIRDEDNQTQCGIKLYSDGAVKAQRGAVVFGTTASNAIRTGTWHHVECEIGLSQTVGTFKVWIDEVLVINETGLDTIASSKVQAQMVLFSDAAFQVHIDDLYIYDDQGSNNNAGPLGDKRVYRLKPNGDTATADWTANAGSPFDAINDDVQDDDTTYIAATDANDESIFNLENVDENVDNILGVMVYGRLRKTDAGTCTVQMSMVSNAAESNGADRPVTIDYSYWYDMHETDPDTSALWTPAGFNASQLKIEKTA